MFTINRILFLIIINFYTTMGLSQNEYIQKKVPFLVDYIKLNNVELKNFSYQITTNGALVYLIDNKEVILLPGNLSVEENGLIIQNEETLKKMIKNDYFPVETQENCFLEDEENRLLDLPNNLQYYFDFFEKELGLKINNETKFDETFFKDFDKKLHKINLKDRKEDFLVPLIILLGNIIVKNKSGNWKISKEYGLYNPYYLPSVILNKVELNIVERILSDLEQPKFYSLKQSYEFMINPKINPALNHNILKIYNDFLNNGLGNGIN